MLGAFVLNANSLSGGSMNSNDGGSSLVTMLSTSPTSDSSGELHIFEIQTGTPTTRSKDSDGDRRCMDSTALLGRRYPLPAVASAF